MKKLLCILLVSLFLAWGISASLAENEIYSFTGGLEMNMGDRYVCVQDDDDETEYMILDGQTGGVLSIMLMNGLSSQIVDTFVDLVVLGQDNSLGNIQSVPVYKTTNEVKWAGIETEIDGSTYEVVVASVGDMVMYGFMMGISFDDVDEILNRFHYAESSETPGQITELDTMDTSVMTLKDYAGMYDLYMYGMADEDINMILTETGHGRFLNSSGTATFEFTVQDGKITVLDTDELVIQSAGLNQLKVNMAGITLDFTKREPMPEFVRVIGAWNAVGVETGTTMIDRDGLVQQGISVEAVFYANGSVDWHAITDSDSSVAMGWGEDNLGYYLKNGSETCRVMLASDTELQMVYPRSGSSIRYYFEKDESAAIPMQEGISLDNGFALGNGFALNLGERYSAFYSDEAALYYVTDLTNNDQIIVDEMDLGALGLTAEESKEIIEAGPSDGSDTQFTASPGEMNGFTWISCTREYEGNQYSGAYVYQGTYLLRVTALQGNERTIQDLLSFLVVVGQ